MGRIFYILSIAIFAIFFNCAIKSGGLLVSSILNFNGHLTTQWFEAVENGEFEEVEKLIDKIDINIRSHVDDETALIIATGKRYAQIVKLLLQVPGIDVNAQNKFGHSALYVAASNSDMQEIFELLINAPGIDINAQNNGYTALMSAHNIEITKRLLQIPGININTTCPSGKTAYIRFCEWQQFDAELIKNKIDELTVKCFQAISDFAKSSESAKIKKDAREETTRNLELIKSITAQIGHNIFDVNGDTLLHKAFSCNATDIVLFLLRDTPDARNLFDIPNKNGLLPLELVNPTSPLFHLCLDLAFASKKKDIKSLFMGLINWRSESDIEAVSNACAYCLRQYCTKRCGRCKTTYYCSQECQKNHWKAHKQICRG